MRQRQRQRLEGELTASENELVDVLREILPYAIQTGFDPFTNSQYNPHNLLHLDESVERCVRLAQDSVRLRSELYIVEPGIGAAYLEKCAELADLDNPHRRGPRRLAASLMERLNDDPS